MDSGTLWRCSIQSCYQVERKVSLTSSHTRAITQGNEYASSICGISLVKVSSKYVGIILSILFTNSFIYFQTQKDLQCVKLSDRKSACVFHKSWDSICNIYGDVGKAIPICQLKGISHRPNSSMIHFIR